MEGKSARMLLAIRSEPRDAPPRGGSRMVRRFVGCFNGCVDIRLRERFAWTYHYIEWTANDLGNGVGLAGVEVCILNTSTCTQTDVDDRIR